MPTVNQQPLLIKIATSLFLFGFACPLYAFNIIFSSSDFNTTPVFSNVQSFSFDIEIGQSLQSGGFDNPVINGVDYAVSGSLVAGTPSTFSAFALNRPEPGATAIPGVEFYNQGSSLNFEIASGADLTDGLQISDLAVLSDFLLPSSITSDPLLSAVTGSSNPVLVFNGRENEEHTGFSRFHPTLLVLNSDGTGSLRNSNNIVNKNGFTEIAFGSEYITDLTFDPANTTLSTDVSNVPIPTSIILFSGGLLYLSRSRLKQA